MDHRIHVNPAQIAAVWNIYNTNSTVKACTSLLKNALLAGGLNFPSAQGAELDVYTQLASNVVDWILCVGIVPVTAEQDSCTGIWVPVIPEPSAVTLYVQLSELGQCMYSASFKHRGMIGAQNNPKIWVWSNTNNRPTSEGNLTTNISSLLDKWELEKFLTNKAMVAEDILSNPPLISEDRPKKVEDIGNNPLNVSYQAVEDSEIARIQCIENIQQAQHTMHSHNWSGGVPTSATEYIQFHEQCATHHAYPPVQRSVVNGPQPKSCLTNLLRLSEFTVDQIYTLMGVINSSKGHGSDPSKVRAGQVSQESMNRNIKCLTGTVERFLNQSYRLCVFKSKYTKRETAQQERTAHKRPRIRQNDDEVDNLGIGLFRTKYIDTNEEEEDEEDPFECTEVSHKHVISMTRIPEVSTTEALALTEAGYITHEEAVAMVRGSMGMTDLSVPVPRPPRPSIEAPKKPLTEKPKKATTPKKKKKS